MYRYLWVSILGIAAEFRLVPGAGHVDILGSPAITAAAAELIHR
jgi:hypothetical protein